MALACISALRDDEVALIDFKKKKPYHEHEKL